MAPPIGIMQDQDELIARVTAAKTTTDIKALLWEWRGPVAMVYDAIAQHASVFDEEIVMLLLVTKSHEDLARNPHLVFPYHDLTARWSLHRLLNETSSKDIVSYGRTLLHLFGQNQLPWEHDVVQELVRLMRDPAVVNSYGERHVQFARALLAHPQMPASFLQELYRLCSKRKYKVLPKYACAFALHPQAPIDFTRSVIDKYIRKYFGYTDYARLARNERVRNNPYLRSLISPYLITHRRQELISFILDLNPNDCAEILRKAPTHVITEALRQKGSEIVRFLEMADLASLLRSDSHELRLLAMACSAYMIDQNEQRAPRFRKSTNKQSA